MMLVLSACLVSPLDSSMPITLPLSNYRPPTALLGLVLAHHCPHKPFSLYLITQRWGTAAAEIPLPPPRLRL